MSAVPGSCIHLKLALSTPVEWIGWQLSTLGEYRFLILSIPSHYRLQAL